jgi:hypothetical protein
MPASAGANAARALLVVGRAGTASTIVLKGSTTITGIDWINQGRASQDAGIAIASTTGAPLAKIWLPSLRHGSEAVSTRLLPVNLPGGRYTVTLLGAGQLSIEVRWTAAARRISTHSSARLKLSVKTNFQTAPFDARWPATIPAQATVIEGYIVYGTSDLADVRYCFQAGQYACLAPLAGYTGVSTSGGTMYYLTHDPGTLPPGVYQFGEIAVSDSPSMQAGGFVVMLYV